MSSFEHIHDFKQAMSVHGITPPETIVTDGKIHRFSHKKNSWYVFHEGDISGGAFGDWKLRVNENWCSKQPNQFTPQQREEWAKKQAEIQASVKAEKLAKQAEAAKKSIKLWADARTDVDLKHGYLLAKGGLYPHGIKQLGQALLIPVYGEDKQLTGCQFIYANGDKKFITGTKKQGCFYFLKPQNFDPNNVQIVCIVEGWANGVTVLMAMNCLVFIAFDCGNLSAVAELARRKYPQALIVMCADVEPHKTGIEAASEAAKAVNGVAAIPTGQTDENGKLDFNDVFKTHGLEAVKKMINEAIQTKKAVPDATSTAPLDDDLARESIDDVGNGGDSQGDEWQEPDPIIAPQEMADYPIEHLPEPLRLLVLEIVDYLQCPIAMAANAVLAALSLSIQGLVNVARDNELIGAVSLFLMVIAESGERKSACDSLVTSHIKELDKQRLLADLDVLKFWQSDMDTWTAEREGLINAIKQTAKNGDSTHSLKEQLKQLDEEKPKKPRGKTMLYEDATIEGLTKGLFNNCPSGGVFSSEAGVVFGSHGMNSDNSMRNMATTNKLWDGGDVITNRADITKNMLLTGRRLTLSLATQESTVRAFFDSSKGLARGTGFGARFLIAWPKSTQGTRLYKAPPLSWPNREEFVKRTTELLNTLLTIDEESGALQPITLYLSPQAHDLWVEFYNYTEQELRIGGELTDIKDVTSKAADNVARLAALFHVYEHGLTGHISEAHILSANYLMDWYLMEAKRFFSEAVLSKELRNTVLLDNWLIQHCQEQQTNHISTRDIQRKCPNSLRDKDLIDAILKHLADLNRVKIVNQGKKKLIALNPKLLGV